MTRRPRRSGGAFDDIWARAESTSYDDAIPRILGALDQAIDAATGAS